MIFNLQICERFSYRLRWFSSHRTRGTTIFPSYHCQNFRFTWGYPNIHCLISIEVSLLCFFFGWFSGHKIRIPWLRPCRGLKSHGLHQRLALLGGSGLPGRGRVGSQDPSGRPSFLFCYVAGEFEVAILLFRFFLLSDYKPYVFCLRTISNRFNPPTFNLLFGRFKLSDLTMCFEGGRWALSGWFTSQLSSGLWTVQSDAKMVPVLPRGVCCLSDRFTIGPWWSLHLQMFQICRWMGPEIVWKGQAVWSWRFLQ